MASRIDLDANATTALLPEVLDAMLPWLTTLHGNPSSSHAAGQAARSAVEGARASVAKLLDASPKEIVFTSGGTEADNLALGGVLAPFVQRGEPVHLITTSIEHHAVLFAAEAWERRGVSVTYLAPDGQGLIHPEALAGALRPDTRLVSLMLANNETGVIQPVGKMARLVKALSSALVHTDAVQAAGKIPIRMMGEFKNVDLLSISGHKMYAPQGTGALFVRSGTPLEAMQFGGPQERQRRAGTENVAGIVGMGRAADRAAAWLASGAVEVLRALRNRLESKLLAALPGASVNGAQASRVANTSNLQLPGIDAESLLIALDMQGVAASFGAACMSGVTEPSHVLLAMGLTAAEARTSLRFSLSTQTTAEEIERATAVILASAQRMRG